MAFGYRHDEYFFLKIMHAFPGVAEMNKKIVVITSSPLPYQGNITDGPGYRLWHLCQILSADHNIVFLSLYESFHLGSVHEVQIKHESHNFRVLAIGHTPDGVATAIEQEEPDILWVPWSSTIFLSRFRRRRPMIVDFIGSGLFEEFGATGKISVPLLSLKLRSLWLGDFLLTTTERQRYYLLGLLAASKRLSVPGAVRNDEKLIHVIRISPPNSAPPSAAVPKDVPQIAKIIIAGATSPWYTYESIVEGLKILRQACHTAFRVYFVGHNPKVRNAQERVREVIERAGLGEQCTFTGPVPYDLRCEYYEGGVAGIVPVSAKIEAELSARARVVDCLWAGLPVVTPGQDEYSQLAVASGAGFVYEPADPSSFASVLGRLLEDPALVSIARARARQLVTDVFDPRKSEGFMRLSEFLRNPHVSNERLVPAHIFWEAALRIMGGWLRVRRKF
jgi:glycosyltransferase involved in cell wall biosynthesis